MFYSSSLKSSKHLVLSTSACLTQMPSFLHFITLTTQLTITFLPSADGIPQFMPEDMPEIMPAFPFVPQCILA
jgi:hypothetical protein